MTTSWGSGRCDAPRAACLMTAAAVAQDRAQADALWKALDAACQATVLWWLAVRWRQLLYEAAPVLSAAARGEHFTALLHALGRACCDPVREFVIGALTALDIRLSVPGCRPCTRLAAEILCQAQLRVADAVGWPRQHLNEICRNLAT